MGQHGEDRFAGGALDAPDGEPAEANPRVMGVARQAPPHLAAGLAEELKAEGEEKGEDELDKRLGVVKELVVVASLWKSTVIVRFLRVTLWSGPRLISMQMAVGAEETW